MPVITTTPTVINDGTGFVLDLANAGPATVLVYGAEDMTFRAGTSGRYEVDAEPIYAVTRSGSATLTVTPIGGGSSGGVSSVAGRTGDVALVAADIGGLGTAATRNVGTSAGQVAAGDDARLTNARTPTGHAASHASGGTDALTLAQTQVAGLPDALTARPTSAAVDTALGAKADDGEVVKLTGTQTIAGAKTLTSPVTVPAATAITHAPRLAQVRLVLVWSGSTYGTKPAGSIAEFMGPDEPGPGLFTGTLTPGDVWLQVDLIGSEVATPTRYVWHPADGWQAIQAVGA